MEQDLFDWGSWDILDTATFQFYTITLKVSIGAFKAGDKFEVATLSYQEGYLHLYSSTNDDTPTLTVKLGLVIRGVE